MRVRFEPLRVARDGFILISLNLDSWKIVLCLPLGEWSASQAMSESDVIFIRLDFVGDRLS